MNYGGEVSPLECWDILATAGGNAALVDVRTRAEWAFVGLPVLDGSVHKVVLQEWQSFPHMDVDQSFTTALAAQLEGLGVSKDAQLCFLCRSGVRSLAAARAMTADGYSRCLNITGGFEGDPDEEGHRGNRNGWKADGLPWKQQ